MRKSVRWWTSRSFGSSRVDATAGARAKLSALIKSDNAARLCITLISDMRLPGRRLALRGKSRLKKSNETPKANNFYLMPPDATSRRHCLAFKSNSFDLEKEIDIKKHYMLINICVHLCETVRVPECWSNRPQKN